MTPKNTYAYDAASRLASVSSGDDEAAYARFANSPHVETLVREHDGGATLATTHSRDFLDRLVSIDSSTGAGAVSSHAYTHDLLGRRTAAERQDGSRWDYAYDEDGQLLSASRQWPDAAPVAGQQFAYAYDGIGNRTAATVNGRESIHTSNTLNQYTQRTVPGALDVRGGALASAHVLVNGVPATRQGDYFHRAVPVDNADAPQHPQIKVRAFGPGIGPGGADLKTGETTGRAYLPQTPETFSHDLDGNLTEDGRWVYTWDAENRLIAMESAPSVPDTAKRKLEFAYDFQGRRIRKRVHDWDGTAYVLADERRYAYDGWNLVAEIVASPTPFVRTYVWGLDLSGTEQGAGGVGGLLAIQENGESHYPAYDGNGNVMALVRGSDGAVSGRYEYGPFGELLEVEEDGIANPFRFSTKFQDAETGLLYYGYRYYDPGTGRWLNRDPIGERGGVNLYGFVRNRPTAAVDALGLITWEAFNAELETINEPEGVFQRFVDLEGKGANKNPNNNYLLTCYCGIIDLRHFGMGLRDVNSGEYTPETYMNWRFDVEWTMLPRPSTEMQRANRINAWRNDRLPANTGQATGEDHPSEALGALAGAANQAWKQEILKVLKTCGADRITTETHNKFVATYGNLRDFVKGHLKTNPFSAPITVDQELNKIGKCCPERKEGQSSVGYFQQHSGLVWKYITIDSPRSPLHGEYSGPGTIDWPENP